MPLDTGPPEVARPTRYHLCVPDEGLLTVKVLGRDPIGPAQPRSEQWVFWPPLAGTLSWLPESEQAEGHFWESGLVLCWLELTIEASVDIEGQAPRLALARGPRRPLNSGPDGFRLDLGSKAYLCADDPNALSLDPAFHVAPLLLMLPLGRHQSSQTSMPPPSSHCPP